MRFGEIEQYSLFLRIENTGRHWTGVKIGPSLALNLWTGQTEPIHKNSKVDGIEHESIVGMDIGKDQEGREILFAPAVQGYVSAKYPLIIQTSLLSEHLVKTLYNGEKDTPQKEKVDIITEELLKRIRQLESIVIALNSITSD